MIYLYGKGVTANKRTARKWFEEAVARGHEDAMAALKKTL
jgi:TPR repeat protein